MQHCFITPTKYINHPDIWGQSDFILALSHLMDDECKNEYCEAIKKANKPIYLDNWLFENWRPEPIDSLINKAELIWAEYVFMPDHLYQSTQTKQAAITFMQRCLHLKKAWWKVAFVPQADNPVDYLACYKWAEESSFISMIWISILSAPKSFWWSRLECLKAIKKYIDPKKPAHLLWLGWDLEDLRFAAENCEWIKTNDSSSAFVHGSKHITYKQYATTKDYFLREGKIEEKLKFDSTKDITTKGLHCIQKNINIIKSLW